MSYKRRGFPKRRVRFSWNSSNTEDADSNMATTAGNSGPQQGSNPLEINTRLGGGSGAAQKVQNAKVTQNDNRGADGVTSLSTGADDPIDVEDDDNFVYSPTTDPRPKEKRRRSSKLLTPSIYLNPPPLLDSDPTSTAVKQNSTMRSIMRHLDQTPLPSLSRHAHVQFLLNPLEEGLRPGYTILDASRPWMLYWCLNGLSLLGEDVGVYHEQLIASLKPLQSPLGGFGGGNQQYPHLAATYAAILSLSITAYFTSLTLEDDFSPALYSKTFSWINRAKMLTWLRSLKLANGGFKVNAEGEEDVRASYCALIVCALMGFDEDELRGDEGETPILEGVREYLSRCQSWEGGLGAKPGAEAHGGYAFCVVGALCLLGEPSSVLKKYLDLPGIISWLSARQYAPEGGLSGRTNKLVDGCYSTWVGGCWSLVEAAVNGPDVARAPDGSETSCLWNREALVRYIMTCCQEESGGLKDKPGVRADQYHSNYVLLGLSSAQNYYYYHPPTDGDDENRPKVMPNFPFQAAFNYTGSRYSASGCSDSKGEEEDEIYQPEYEDLATRDQNRVEPQHPIFNIPLGAEVGVYKWWIWWKENGRVQGVLIEE